MRIRIACGLLAVAVSLFPAGATRASAATRSECPPPPSQGWSVGDDGTLAAIACQWAERRLLVVGETHGTAEIPRFVGDLVERASRRHAVALGLERTTDEEAALASYLDSRGTPADKARLMAGRSWSKDLSDGRSSEAMFGLIERVRLLRAQGRRIDVFLLEKMPKDMAALQAPGALQRYAETSMAEAVRGQMAAGSGRLVIAYVGSYHTRVEPAPVGDAGTSLSWTLRQARPLVLQAGGDGTAWNCTASGCGPHKASAADGALLAGSAADRGNLPGVEVARLAFPRFSSSSPAVPH